MRWLTVRFRVTSAFAAFAVVLIAVLVVLAPRRLREEHDVRIREMATAVLVVLELQIADALARNDDAAVAAAVENATRIDGVARVEVRRRDGDLLQEAGAVPTLWASLPATGHATVGSAEHFALQEESPRAPGVVLRIAMSRAGLERELQRLYSTLLLIGGMVVLFSALGALILTRSVTRPIEQVTRGVRAMERGDAEHIEVSAPKGDELYDLAQAINRMRDELSHSYRELARAARRARVRADALERANVDLDRFAYAASHDLRAPLRGISTLAEFIGEDLQGVEGVGEDVHANITLLRRRVQRMDNLLMGLLDYSRVGRAGIEPERVDVGALVASVIERLAVPPGFEIVIEDPLPVLETPRALLERVLLHLIGNAIKHHDRREGRIEVAYEKTARHAVFTVRDDGPGIPVALHEKAFKIFSTLKRRDEVEGSGLGLALVRKIVETVGGTLTLESSGRGAAFILHWPLDWESDDATQIDVVARAKRAHPDA